MPDTTCRPVRGCSAVLLRPPRVEVFSNCSVISRAGRVVARLRSCSGLFFLALGLGILTVASSPAAAKSSPQRFEYSLPRMGTLFRIEMYVASDAEASKAAEAGEQLSLALQH